jgi:hypothetical protein
MRPLGDRRTRVRFEVVGILWGALELSEPARIVNLSDHGALIESKLAVPVDSTQPVHFLVKGNRLVVEARVIHLRRVLEEDDPPRYLIGVEFLTPTLPLLHSISGVGSSDTMVD